MRDYDYYERNFKTIEEVIEFLYVNKQSKLALAVLDRERLLNEAWGKIAILEKPPTPEGAN